MEEYIVVSKKWLEEQISYKGDNKLLTAKSFALNLAYKIILGNNKPLQPILEDAFDKGEDSVKNLFNLGNFTVSGEKKEYISN